MHDLARMLAAVAGPAEPRELTGEASALAAFAQLASPVGISPAASRPARRRLSRRPARARLPIAAALVTAAAGLGSMAAAYVGALPGPIQQMARVTVGAPLPRHDGSQRPPAVTHPRPGVTRDPSTSSLRPSRSAAPAQVHGSVNRHRSNYWFPGHRPWSVAPTCIPLPSPTPSLAKPGPAPTPTRPPTLVKPGPSQSPAGGSAISRPWCAVWAPSPANTG